MEIHLPLTFLFEVEIEMEFLFGGCDGIVFSQVRTCMQSFLCYLLNFHFVVVFLPDV